MRLGFEIDHCGHGLIVRLPWRFGVSFWPPDVWALMFGIRIQTQYLSPMVEWRLGPFGGEMWREHNAPGDEAQL